MSVGWNYLPIPPGSKIDKLLTGQSALEKKFTNLETKVNSNSTQIQDIIQSLDFESDTIKDQASQIQDLTSKLEKRDDELHRANHAIATMESEINALERYTSGFNIRIIGITEEEGEDCVSRVHKVLNGHFAIYRTMLLRTPIASVRPDRIIRAKSSRVSTAAPSAVTSWWGREINWRTPTFALQTILQQRILKKSADWCP